MSVLQNQLQMMCHFKYETDTGEELGSENINEIIFYKKNSINDGVTIIFENYFVHPFEGFDFHVKYNHNIPPYSKEMVGYIEKETEKMYYFKGHALTDCKMWEGWVPKKSCTVKGDK